jgi:hypothetical protein
LDPGSEIQDPGYRTGKKSESRDKHPRSAILVLANSYILVMVWLATKIQWRDISSMKYDPGCPSWIPDLDFFPLLIWFLDLGV